MENLLYHEKFHDEKHFNGNREKAIIRDNNRCKRCNMSRVDHKNKYYSDFHVHHINKDKKDNRLSNLITLCGSCHNIVHDRKHKKERNIKIFNLALAGLSYAKIGIKYNISKQRVSDIIRSVSNY